LFFVVQDAASGKELWKSDGTPLGTSLVADIMSGIAGSNAAGLFNAAGTLFFSADDGTHGAELWTAQVGPSSNVAPSFEKGADLSVDDGSSQSYPAWATAISAGAFGDAGQSVHFVLSNDNAGLFAVPPQIDRDGRLTLTAAFNAKGLATIEVVLKDDGGTASGGSDLSEVETLTIKIEKPHPWYNSAGPLDVRGGDNVGPDGQVVAGDALAIINWINEFGAGKIPDNSEIGLPFGFLDTTGGVNDTGDNFVALNDALAVINAINAGQGGEGESFAAGVSVSVSATNNPQLSTAAYDDWTDLLTLLAIDMAQQNAPRRNILR
jgi:ELWxxDGT repeat protein